MLIRRGTIALGLLAALSCSGCATVMSAVIGAAVCGGSGNCVADAVATGIVVDATIAQGIAEASVASQQRRARQGALTDYVCASEGSTQTIVVSALSAPEASGTCADQLDTPGGCRCRPLGEDERVVTSGGEAPIVTPPCPYEEGPASDLGPPRGEVLAALRSVQGDVRRCGGGRYGTISTHVTFASDGSVSDVRLNAAGLPDPIRTCATDVVSGLRVGSFERDSVVVSYPFLL